VIADGFADIAVKASEATLDLILRSGAAASRRTAAFIPGMTTVMLLKF
jgi:hypothetical protein